MAVQMERKYTKKQILGLYLSRVYFGSGASGLEAASRRFFNKPAAKLTIREAAALAAVLKSPSGYSPVEEPERSADRSKLVQPEVMMAPIVWLMSAKSDGVTGRRFIAKDWDKTLDPRDAAAKAGAQAGW